MSTWTKTGIGLAVLGLLGWIGALVAESGTSGANGANIGVGILHLAGEGLVVLGLVLAVVGLVVAKRNKQRTVR